jgi:hypothetical protein
LLDWMSAALRRHCSERTEKVWGHQARCRVLSCFLRHGVSSPLDAMAHAQPGVPA